MSAVRKVIAFETGDEIAAFLVKTWREISLRAATERGKVTVALSGGTTPGAFYRALAAEGDRDPWKDTHVFLVDERFVPRTDKESNFGMIWQTLLARLSIPEENINPVDTDASGPDEAAREYEERLVRHFRLASGEFPRFDIILLGLGEDGHTASLFPGTPALEEKVRLARDVHLEGPLHNRVTLTLPVINHGRRVFFLVTGERKARTLRKVVEEGDETLPASRVHPEDGSMIFLADREATGLLSKGSLTGLCDEMEGKEICTG